MHTISGRPREEAERLSEFTSGGDRTVPHSTRRVSVAVAAGIARVVSRAPIAAGDLIVHIEGILQDRPSRYSVQVEHGMHVDVPPESRGVAAGDPGYHWQFLNHSCAPNARVVGRTVIALRPITLGEEITFNYNTTEYEVACPFSCWCGTADCAGEIGGFSRLDPAAQERLRPLLAAHLRNAAA